MSKFFLSILFLASLRMQSFAAEIPDIPQESEIKLTALLAALENPGNNVYPEPKFYGSNLWQYINGAAEAYHSYDFIALALQQYRTGKSEITVEIYDMGKPINAFGIYAAERSPDLNFIEIGAQGYSEPSMLNFYQERYYVKLALDEPGEHNKSLTEIALQLSGAIGENHAIPAFYQIFPLENRLANTEQYLKKAPLGHPFLTPAYQVSYKKNEHLFHIVVSQAESDDDASERFHKLMDHFRQTGTVADLPGKAFRGENAYVGEMICSSFAEHVILILNPPENWKLLLEAMRINLKKAIK
jgi:hypothetical protein